MSSSINQVWTLNGGALALQVTNAGPFPANLISDLGPVVAAIEEFIEAWGYHPPMPDWERQLLSDEPPT